MRFVIIDDEVLIARDLAAQVRNLEYEVTGVASSLARGLVLVEAHRPDIVLMDIQLRGDEDGILGAEHIYNTFGIPSVYVTAYSDESTLLRAQKTHPLGYILKPFRTQEVKATLLMAIAQQRLARAVEENRSWLYAVLSSVPDTAVAMDGNGFVRFANHAAEEMLGTADLPGRKLEEIVQLHDTGLAETGLSTPAPFVAGIPRRRALLIGAAGQRTPVEFTITDVPATQTNAAGQLLVIRDVSDRDRIDKLLARERDLLAGRIANADEELDRTKEELRDLSAELMLVQDAERRRIARELHDDLAQQLAVLGMNSEAIASLTASGSEAAHRLAQLTKGLAAASEYVRTVSHRLHPSVLEHLGILMALRGLVDDFRVNEDAPVRFRSNVENLSLPLSIASGAYRITQEALRNVAKHARGSAVAVALSLAGKRLRICVRDYGPGFDAAAVRFHHGLGLISMQERARAIKGALSIRSKPGTGTLIVLTVPVGETNDISIGRQL